MLQMLQTPLLQKRCEADFDRQIQSLQAQAAATATNYDTKISGLEK